MKGSGEPIYSREGKEFELSIRKKMHTKPEAIAAYKEKGRWKEGKKG